MRRSFQNNRKVTDRLLEHLPGTIVLAVAAMLFAMLLGLPLGVVSAMKNGRWQDRIITFLTLLGISAPSFFMAVLIIRVFAVDLEWCRLGTLLCFFWWWWRPEWNPYFP